MRRILIPGLIVVGFAVAIGALAMAGRSYNAEARKATQPSGSVAAKSSETAASASAAAPAAIIRLVNDPAPAPPFLSNDLEGKIVSSAALQGKVVILNFWATWCPPCREEIPELIALAKRYPDRLEVVGVSVDDDASPRDVKEFASEIGVNYSVLMDAPHHDISEEYGAVTALPTSFIIDPEGRVVQKHVGLVPSEIYENEVRYLLGLPVNAKVQTFEDVGQVFLKNADRATVVPGVDLKNLTPEQRKEVLKRINTEMCTCGCKLTIAQCRLSDDSCAISKKLAAQIVQEVIAGSHSPTSTAQKRLTVPTYRTAGRPATDGSPHPLL